MTADPAAMARVIQRPQQRNPSRPAHLTRDAGNHAVKPTRDGQGG